jgi:uncharacterized protein
LHTTDKLKRLETLLDNSEVMPDAMTVSELDGFVAGLLLCPDLIMPSEWLPEVWGLDDPPKFESDQQAKDTLDAVMAHYNRVADALARRDTAYGILIEEAESDELPFWEFWISGFEQAMGLRPESWNAYLKSADRDASSSFSVLCTLVLITNGECELPPNKLEEIKARAADLIPSAVVAMNAWVKSQSGAGTTGGDALFGSLGAANDSSQPAHSKKVGRNDPCPCGSGLKHKKCCGAN